jgi:YidC/Oxa1 family membrane protein insertase
MDNKRYLLALALSMGVLLIWMQFMVPPAKPKLPANQQSAAPAEAPRAQAPPSAGAQESQTPEKAAENEAVPQVSPRTEAAALEEKVVETDLYRVRFENRGGRVVSWILKQYQDDEGKPLELVSVAAAKLNRHPLDLEFDEPKLTERLRDAMYLADISPGQDGSTRVQFHYADGSGTEIRKRVEFRPSSYLVIVQIQAQRDGKPLKPTVVVGSGFGTESGLPPSNGDRNDITQIAFSREGKVFHRGRDAMRNIHQQNEPGPILWAGLEDHYFATLLLPGSGAESLQLRLDPVIEEGREKQFLSVGVRPREGEAYKLYVGPKDRQLLASLNLGLEGIVNYGFLPEIAQALFFLLRHINQAIANWGLSIIILTVIIRLAFFPLTHKSSVSMRRTQEKMKRIQPRIEAIKKRYHSMKRDMANRQKMNEEIMGLYAKEGMNPLASMTGCLPLLLQLPILWGFYNLLVNAIELRHAPFALWIEDLSKKDPYYITPIVMGITMLIQQAMTGSSIPDPTQRRIMMAMPVMFTWFFKDLPSGLVLYWLVNNILGIGQQYLINRQVAQEDSQKPGA